MYLFPSEIISAALVHIVDFNLYQTNYFMRSCYVLYAKS